MLNSTLASETSFPIAVLVSKIVDGKIRFVNQEEFFGPGPLCCARRRLGYATLRKSRAWLVNQLLGLQI